MLKPGYFINKEDRILEIYRQLVDFIMHDISMRLLKAGEMSGTTDRLIYRLRMMGESRQEIENKLSEMTGLSRKELRNLLQDAVMTSWEDDRKTLQDIGADALSPLENPAVIRIMDAEYKKSLGELSNLTRSIMNKSQADLINMLDEAEFRVSSGVQSYSSAVCDILDRYARKGIEIEYPTGTKRSLEAAVRMCVVTSMNQTAAQVTNQYILESKSEYVLVSAHLGARTQQKGQPYLAGHDNWQGKVYRIRGSEPGYPNLLESTGYDIDPVSGTGIVVDPRGLHGYNCRHSHKPWDKRLRNPYLDKNGNLKIDSEENKKLYDLQQKQRMTERAIRKTKRELFVKQQEINGVAETDVRGMLKDDYDKLAYRLREQNKAYNDFCEQNGLQKQYDRIKVGGFKKKQSSIANGAATRYENKQVNLSLKETSDKWAEDARRELLSDEKVLSIRDKETAVVYDANGKFVFQKRGSYNEVNFTLLEMKKLKGCIISHNHPSGGSLSVSDIYTLKKSYAAEIRVATSDGVYYLHRPSKWPSEINTADKIQKERDRIAIKVKKKYNELYREGKISKIERYRLCSDEVNRLFAEKYNMKYGKDRFDEQKD